MSLPKVNIRDKQFLNGISPWRTKQDPTILPTPITSFISAEIKSNRDQDIPQKLSIQNIHKKLSSIYPKNKSQKKIPTKKEVQKLVLQRIQLNNQIQKQQNIRHCKVRFKSQSINQNKQPIVSYDKTQSKIMEIYSQFRGRLLSDFQAIPLLGQCYPYRRQLRK